MYVLQNCLPRNDSFKQTDIENTGQPVYCSNTANNKTSKKNLGGAPKKCSKTSRSLLLILFSAQAWQYQLLGPLRWCFGATKATASNVQGP